MTVAIARRLRWHDELRRRRELLRDDTGEVAVVRVRLRMHQDEKVRAIRVRRVRKVRISVLVDLLVAIICGCLLSVHSVDDIIHREACVLCAAGVDVGMGLGVDSFSRNEMGRGRGRGRGRVGLICVGRVGGERG